MKKLFSLITLLCFSQMISAGITITGTRIIFPSNKNLVTVQLNNSSTSPALAQVWIDDGDENQIPPPHKMPFILTPALAPIGPQKGQMIRILPKKVDYLSQDRESIFWLNVLDIPPSLKDDNQNKLNISVRSRIKLFYRPDTLNITQKEAFDKLELHYSNQTKILTINNPTPYFISFYSISYNPSRENKIDNSAHMVAPYSTLTLNPQISFKLSEIKYGIIDDYGANRFNTIQIKN